MAVHNHLGSIALWASIIEKLCCVSCIALLLHPDLFPPLFCWFKHLPYWHKLLHIHVCYTQPSWPNSLQVVFALCLLACICTNKQNSVKWLAPMQLGDSLQRCGVEIYLCKQTPTPQKISSHFSGRVFWLEVWSLKNLFLADIWSIFMKCGDYVRNIWNPNSVSWIFNFFPSF